MSVAEIKREIASLGAAELGEVAAFLAALRGGSTNSADLEDFLKERLDQAKRGELSRRSVSEIWSDLRASRSS
jgi:hypothetical protein